MYRSEAMVESIVGAVVGNHTQGRDKNHKTRKLENPGDFVYHRNNWNKIIGMMFICPCGCNGVKIASFGPRHGRTPIWTWNGSIERPTLTPALQCLKDNWKSNLVNGVFIPC